MASLRKTILTRGKHRHAIHPTDFSPIKWTEIFDFEHQIEEEVGCYNVYTKNSSGPLLLCIHGGGYSALTWGLFAEEISDKINCQILAVDLRGHGKTSVDDSDLSLNTLTEDIGKIIEHIYKEEKPPIIIVGHSLGGAIAVEAASLLSGVLALVVIDVVEGTALESLPAMQNVLSNRPKNFNSIESAIMWSYKNQTSNLKAARLSMPGQIKNMDTGLLASDECLNYTTDPLSLFEDGCPTSTLSDTIQEESDEDIAGSSAPSLLAGPSAPSFTAGPSAVSLPPLPTSCKALDIHRRLNPYMWRIDLSKTSKFWSGWFNGLSNKFLSVPVPKMLLLANIHGLDTTLTVAQMQGKFQLQILKKSGHAIQEDRPQDLAEAIAGFLVRQRLAVAINDFVPSVSTY